MDFILCTCSTKEGGLKWTVNQWRKPIRLSRTSWSHRFEGRICTSFTSYNAKFPAFSATQLACLFAVPSGATSKWHTENRLSLSLCAASKGEKNGNLVLVPTFLWEWAQKTETNTWITKYVTTDVWQRMKNILLHVVTVYFESLEVHLQGSMIFTWISVDRFTRR